MTVSSASAGPDDRPPADLLRKIPAFDGGRVSLVRLTGGLTNRNYKVTTADGRAYVLRISDPAAGALAIDRAHEYRNSVIAAASGVGAEVVDWLPESGAMVLAYIDGPTWTDASFRHPGNLERVADSCRRLHGGDRFVNQFDMFEVQRRYLSLASQGGYRIPPGYDDFRPLVTAIRRVLGHRPDPLVACHNDLLAANFVDDGDRVRLIDYEYSGNNQACFELGNIWSECHLDLDQLEHLVTCYYGRPRPSRVAQARLHGLMSQYGWTLWACIQAATSSIAFDYWDWGKEKYERAVATFRGQDLDRLLDQAQEED